MSRQPIINDMYYDLFQRSADAMLLIVNNEFVDINKAALKMLGYKSKQQVKQIHPSKLSPELQPCGRNSFEKAEAMIQMALQNGSHCFEWVHQNSLGENFYVEVMLTALGKGDDIVIHTVWRDISDRHKAQQNLRLAKSIVDNIREAVFIMDLDAKIIFFNHAFTELTGYTTIDAIGKKASFLQSGIHDQTFYACLWQQLLTNGQWTGDIWDKKKNGKLMLSHLKIDTVFNESGAPEYFVAILTDITELKLNEKKLQRLAYFDSLTSLPNRRRLESIIEDFIKLDDINFALLFIDLDHFKPINDQLGHDFGDKLLEAVAQRMLDSIREVGTVGRVGGDEFVLIIPAPFNVNDLFAIAHRLIAHISNPYHIEGNTVEVGASIGISLYPEHSHCAEKLYQYADLAMYQAKQMGGNNVFMFNPDLDNSNTTIQTP